MVTKKHKKRGDIEKKGDQTALPGRRSSHLESNPRRPLTINYYIKRTSETDDELRNAIWTDKNGMEPKGGYPQEWYEDELYRRTGSKKGFHEE